ncbi:MAG: hypothetical protein LDLANPLL_00457 [Turneriella sp.]|nr:hypothetical protein [Turneriella sp.]
MQKGQQSQSTSAGFQAVSQEVPAYWWHRSDFEFGGFLAVQAGFATVLRADMLVNYDFDRDNIEFFRSFTINFKQFAAAARTLFLCWIDIVNNFFARYAIGKWLSTSALSFVCLDFGKFVRFVF